MSKELLLIDGHGLAFRGFYALPPTLTAADGTPTNAVVGFTNMLVKCIDEWGADGVGLFFDPHGPTRRKDIYAEYKAGRKPAPEEFKVQMPLIIDISRAMGLPVCIRDGIEADDCIIATARKAAAEGWRVKILSADKDLFQVVGEGVAVVRPAKGVSDFRNYDEEYFTKEYGFTPASMADYLALLGDAVDNIPGVQGIGEKGAKELISQYGSLDGIYAHLGEIAKGRRAKLEAGREQAYVSKSLIVPIDTEPLEASELVLGEPDAVLLREMCERLGLRKLLARFVKDKTVPEAQPPKTDTAAAQSSLFAPEPEAGVTTNTETASEVAANSALEPLLESPELALVPVAGEKAFVADRSGRVSEVSASDGATLDKLAKWAETGVVYLYGYREALAAGVFPLPADARVRDLETIHYMLHPDRGGSAIEKTLGAPLPQGAALAAALFSLYDGMHLQLDAAPELGKLMTELDVPLSRALASLQRGGLHADAEKLKKLEADLTAAISATEDSIAETVGERINLNSPKQVGGLLFEKLLLPPVKKTKSGYSTDASVLEELARLPEPLGTVPGKILEFREQSKVLSGFVEPFLKLAQEGDGFIHSTFDQLATGTGRLASRDPNVQNMPVFGGWADRFRECFTPSAPERTFVAADYSQIELRVLAHLCGEERLLAAFREGRDVHMETASWVFGLPPEDITPEQRRFAKVVNFGLLYGMSAHGLAQRLGISRLQAASMVERYFSVLPRVKNYLEESIKAAKAAGYTRSIFGRRRPLAEVSTVEGRGNNPIDRVAVNTPIQSSASDIAKIALMRFHEVVNREFTDARIILQIHDSIVCECKKSDAEAVEKRLVETMEGVNVLSVPVKAEPKRGDSLKEV